MQKPLYNRSGLSLLFVMVVALIFVLGNLRDIRLYWDLLPYTKPIFQTLGFEQRWGMYGFDYRWASYSRYVYRTAGEEPMIVKPRYYRQSIFNPFQFVKMEDYIWYYNPSRDNEALISGVLKYYCKHPDTRTIPDAIDLQLATAPFPSMEERASAFNLDREYPRFETVFSVRCR